MKEGIGALDLSDLNESHYISPKTFKNEDKKTRDEWWAYFLGVSKLDTWEDFCEELLNFNKDKK
jgi:hypothetical protein